MGRPIRTPADLQLEQTLQNLARTYARAGNVALPAARDATLTLLEVIRETPKATAIVGLCMLLLALTGARDPYDLSRYHGDADGHAS